MSEIYLDVEIITPLILHGADGIAPEIRSPSFKGMMRYWWRAVKAEEKIKSLLEEESSIFGSSKEKTGGKSKFSIRLINDKKLNYAKVPFLPHKGNNSPKALAFTVNQSFSVVLFSNRRINFYQDILEISLLLGGLGKRSRRGFGSLHGLKWNFKNKNELENFILQKLNLLSNDSFKIDGSLIKRKNTVEANYPYIKEISFGTPDVSANNLLVKIGQASSLYNNNALGFIKPKRMASPIYVSIARLQKEFIPVIVTLNSVFPKDFAGYTLQKQEDFKKAI